jgi:hypothetical protein
MNCFLFSAPRPLDKVQIPKPSGSVTRLSRNGYSLEAALGWQDHELYVKVQVMSKPLVRPLCTHCFEAVCAEASQYPPPTASTDA